jgi:hypothetical protein
MSKYLKYSLIAALLIAVLGITVVGVAYAQTDDPPPRPHDALAELLGLTTDELHDLIQEGSTLEELAEDAGVDLDAFWQEMQEKKQEFMKARLEEALDSGDISQDQYDWMLEGIENGYMGGGRGAGGFPGRGGFKDGDGSSPFENQDGTKPFGGRSGFGGRARPGGCFGMQGFDN